MKFRAELVGAQTTSDGELVLGLAVEPSEQLEKWIAKKTGESMMFEAKGEPRSLNANNYFWKLCELIAQKMGSTQDEVHDLMLYRYGVRGDLRFKKSMIPAVEKSFDIIIIQEDYGDEVEARCFLGSRHYDTEEMARLIDGVVSDARDQGISLLNPEEVERLVADWKGVA